MIATARIVFIILLVGSNAVMANDGFYQGAGSTLTPIKNANLRVREERLRIAPIEPPVCYSVYANGKPIKEGNDMEVDAHARVTLGSRVKCKAGDTDNLKVKWSASATYEVEVLQSQPDVQMGFPVATWEREYTDSIGIGALNAPGVANFHTYMNGEEITQTQLKVLKHGEGKSREQNEIGYSWNASFQQGTAYELKTEYDFGEFNSNGFYDGREYKRGETPWFIGANAQPLTAGTLIYYLTPLNTWAAPPPELIDIEVRLPSSTPVTYAVPGEVKPSCISLGALHYTITNRFPGADLTVTIPNSEWWKKESLKPMSTPEQWRKWLKTLGGESVRFSCDVLDEINKHANPNLKAEVKRVQCVASCGY